MHLLARGSHILSSLSLQEVAHILRTGKEGEEGEGEGEDDEGEEEEEEETDISFIYPTTTTTPHDTAKR